MNYRNRKLLDLAEGQACANCGADDGTVVAAHSNMSVHGKGKSIKSHDVFTAHLCYRCHMWLDQGSGMDPTDIYNCTRHDKDLMFRAAMEHTWLHLWQSGRVKVTK